MKNVRNRLLVILAVGSLSVLMFWPLNEKINLGLDLRGGIHLIVQVQTEDAIQAEVDQAREQIESRLIDQGVAGLSVVRADGLSILISGFGADQESLVREEVEQWENSYTYSTATSEGQRNYRMDMLVAMANFLRNQAVNQARTIISRRIDQYGVAEPTISIYGSGDVKDQIIIELPGVDDPERVKDLIGETGKLELKLVHPQYRASYASQRDALAAFNDLLPSEYEIVPQRARTPGDERTFLVVRRATVLTGSHLKNARRSEDNLTGRSEVSFFLNAEGVNLFSTATGEHVGELLAIVLDGEVYSAPNIEGQINTEQARITGDFSIEEADDLALVLRSGALPARILFLENRTIGPSLGLDSIRKGVRASLLGMVLVALVMLLIYRFSGLNAVICLLLNLSILLGVLAYFRATLTLPGIAGIILTIGMAVDANILIFERIKEELKLGKTIRAAVEAGFEKVFSTIIDTNVTTLVAALFLYQFGTGPLKGFAITLAIGLLANIFTAVFVSRTFFLVLLQRREVQRLSI